MVINSNNNKKMIAALRFILTLGKLGQSYQMREQFYR